MVTPSIGFCFQKIEELKTFGPTFWLVPQTHNGF
jgi:hypothetical protein